jgi:hypothetical protein
MQWIASTNYMILPFERYAIDVASTQQFGQSRGKSFKNL